MLSALTLRPPVDPFREFGSLFQSLLGRPWSTDGSGVRVGYPALNVWETEPAYVVEAELPGLTLEDVEVSVLDNTMTLSGQHQDASTEGVSYRRRERRSGSFERELRLPGRIDASKVTATLRDGVLTVTVPKAGEAMPRKIEVKVR